MSKRFLYFLISIAPVFTLLSCSENEEEDDEFANWQERNETYFNDIYAQAIADQNDDLDTIRCYSLTNAVATDKDDYIVVRKLENGTSMSGSPMFTDSVKISYRGRLIPTENYTDGYVFDQTYQGDFNWNSVHTTSTYFNSFVQGFATALLNMTIGDRWRVYIPYKLGYGSSGSSSIKGYSTLIFDISLHAFYRPDTDKFDVSVANTKSTFPLNTWVTE